LWQKNPQVVKQSLLYYEPASDQYEIFWIEFPMKLSAWWQRLQEAPEYKEKKHYFPDF